MKGVTGLKKISVEKALGMTLGHDITEIIPGKKKDVAFSRGKIIEEGSHDELLEAGGHYAELYNTYFRHQSLEYIEESGKLTDAA